MHKVNPTHNSYTTGVFNSVTISLLRDCNLNCICCDLSKMKNRALSQGEVVKIIDKLRSYKVNYLFLTGGEPTLRKDLPKIIRYAKQKLGCKVYLSTNGINLDSILTKSLIKSGLDTIDISIYSHDPLIYDKITGVTGSHQILFKNIHNINKIVSKSKLILKASVVIMNYNYNNIYRLIDIAAKYNIKSILFVLVSMRSKTRGKDNFSVLTKDQLKEFYFKIYPRLLKKAIKKNLRVEVRPMLYDLVDMSSEEITKELTHPSDKFEEEIDNYSKGLYGKKFNENSKCYNSLYDLVINTEGKVYTCCTRSFSKFESGMGNLLQEDLSKILSSRKDIKNESCLRCKSFFDFYRHFNTLYKKF